MNIISNDRMTRIVSVVLTVVLGVLFVSLLVNAATTISTNVVTDGTLSVTGASTLTGLTSMVQASSTRFSVHGTAYFGGSATSTFNSAGLGTFQGFVSQASSSVVGNFTITGNSTSTSGTTTTSFFGAVLSANSLSIGGSASSTINTSGDLLVTGSTTLQNFTFKNATSTTSNTATSTFSVGCIQTYATSTATAVRLVLSSAASSTPTFGAGNAVGGVSWNYGTCPI